MDNDLKPINRKALDEEFFLKLRNSFESVQEQIMNLNNALEEWEQERTKSIENYVKRKENLLEQYKPEFVRLTDIHEEIKACEKAVTSPRKEKETAETISLDPVPDPDNWEDTLEEENKEIVSESIKISIGPDKKVKNKRKKKKAMIKEAAFVLGASAVLSSIAIPSAIHLSNTHYQNTRLKENRKEYQEEILNTYTQDNGLVYDASSGQYNPNYTYEWGNIIKEVYEKYEDPVTAFYLIYTNLDEYCKNYKLESIFSLFNDYYKTDYKSLEDLYKKHNFENFNDWKEYVGYDLSNLDEGRRM